MVKKGKNKGRESNAVAEALKSQIADLFQACVLSAAKQKVSPKEAYGDHVHIRSMVDAIKVTQVSASDKLRQQPRLTGLKNMLSWLQGSGVDYSAVELLQINDDSFGLKASRDIGKGESFLHIPTSLMITRATIAQSQLGSVIDEDPLLSKMPNVALTFFLVYELHNSKSAWTPYIQCLPSSFDNVLHFTCEDLQVLRGSLMFTSGMSIWRSIVRQYAYLHNLLMQHPKLKSSPFAKSFNYNDYVWAVSVVMTRQNLVPSDDGSATLALAPLLDMCNHRQGSASIQYDEATSCCCCVCDGDIGKGDEIYICYGQRTNTEFVMHNGFFSESNPNDNAIIRLKVNDTDAEVSLKRDMLDKVGLGGATQYALANSSAPLTGDVLAFLKVCCASHDELVGLQTLELPDLKSLLWSDECVSVSNEKLLLHFIYDRCGLLLKCYPTRLSEDEGQLTKPGISACCRLALQLIANEKKILQNTMNYAKTNLALAAQ